MQHETIDPREPFLSQEHDDELLLSIPEAGPMEGWALPVFPSFYAAMDYADRANGPVFVRWAGGFDQWIGGVL